MHRKKLLAFAVAGAFAPALAMADGGNVTIYGTINTVFENVKADGATGAGANLDSLNRVSNGSSNIGFKGTEDLGGGLKAWFQCETSANTDAGPAGICGRNSAVGLQGSWGNVFLGNWDTPYKTATGGLDPAGNTHIVAYVALLHSPGALTANTTGGNVPGLSFDRRQNNSVQYWTPNLGGFQAKFGYGANEEKPVKDITPPIVNPDPKMWSGSLAYDNGPLYAAFAYERHDDYLSPTLFGAGATGSEDRGWEVGAGYWIVPQQFRIVAAFENLEYESEFAGGAQRLDRDAWMIGGLYKSGPMSLGLNYVKAKDYDVNAAATAAGVLENDTGARFWTLRGGYSLSKRTELFAHYANLRNDANNNYAFGHSALAGAANGTDPKGFGVGIKHTF